MNQTCSKLGKQKQYQKKHVNVSSEIILEFLKAGLPIIKCINLDNYVFKLLIRAFK